MLALNSGGTKEYGDHAEYTCDRAHAGFVGRLQHGLHRSHTVVAQNAADFLHDTALRGISPEYDLSAAFCVRSFPQNACLLRESATDPGTGMVYTFRLNLRRSD
jgi:hypothetical protein